MSITTSTKVKFVIAKAKANAYWGYYGGARKKEGAWIINEIADCFLDGCISKAKQFDSYEEAIGVIKGFGETYETIYDEESTVTTLLGSGIFKVEKVFVNSAI